MKIKSLLAITLCVSSLSQAAVWQTQNTWNQQWEDRYGEWMTKQDADFFEKSGTPWSGVKLDCADAIYSFRIAFSYLNKLPFAMKPSSGGGAITNDMSRFDSLSEAQRVRSFLLYVYEVGSTHSLPSDTYPVRINRDWIRPGSVITTDAASHHSWTIARIDSTGIPYLLFGSRPAKTRLWTRAYIPSMEFAFPNGLRESTNAGFRNFKEPQDINKPSFQIDGYSNEQYAFGYGSYRSTMQDRLATRREDADQKMVRLLNLSCQEARERVGFVSDALNFLATRSSNYCMNATEFDDMSTPSRDTRFIGAMEELRDAYRTVGNQVNSRTREQAESVLGRTDANQGGNAFCPVQIARGQTVSLGEIRARAFAGKLSSNPNESIEYRWGSQTPPGPRARACPKY